MKHGRGNDGLATASVAHRAMDLFDHHHGGEERSDGHQHHQNPATASDPQDGLIAVIGGSAMAAGDASVVSGFVESFAVGQGAYSIAMCRRRFHHPTGSRAIETRTARCVGTLGTRRPRD
jgi:hypothetical protein